jgi:hypothetical protein
MKYQVSLPADSKRSFFRTAGLPRFDRGCEPIEVELSREQKASLIRKGLTVVVDHPVGEEDKISTATGKSRRKENE